MKTESSQSADLLLWLGAGVVALMAAAWLIVAAPWSAPDGEALTELAVAAPDVSPAPAAMVPETQATTVGNASRASDPLHMAKMALEAGMLIEPEAYSAWTLFGKVADEDPDNAEARDGLDQVTAALLSRANTALEQGRYDDASAIAATIAGRYPGHAGARALTAEITAATAPQPEPEPSQPQPSSAPAPQAAAATADPVDPIPALDQAFRDAMAQNAVLRPAGTSAIDIVGEMIAADPAHELTVAARDLLVTEMLDRSAQSIEALDTRAAQTWIDSAATLAADAAQIERARERLTQHLIDTETQRMLPASQLKPVRTTPPDFPRVALERGIEGWVEIEFTVSPEGETESVTVTDASHERFFRNEAVAAVSEWRFEPVVFMGRPIPKRSYTRLEFVFD